MNTILERAARLPLRAEWYAIPLRLIVGFGFLQHGYAKLARGPEDFTGILQALGMPHPALLAWATILVEIFGGLAVLMGAFIPLLSLPMVFVLLVDCHGAPAKRLQLHQAAIGERRRSAFRPARL